MIRIICRSILVIVMVSFVPSITKHFSPSSQWCVQQLPNRQWWHSRYSSGVWMEEKYYTEDHHTLLEHRYWDSLGRMIEIEYDDDGMIARQSIRE